MASVEITEMRNNPEYKNSYAVRDAFKYLCEGLRPFAEREMKQLHSLLISKTSGAVCNCPLLQGKPNPHTYVKTSCIWAKELGKLHCKKKKSSIPWHQSDSTKWHDPVVGYWEIAKIFMSGLGNDKSNVKDPSSTDSTGLLNLLYSCKHFKVQQKLVVSVRNWRNKLAHSPNQLLTDSEKNSAIDKILNLLDDLQLSCKEVQGCRIKIEGVRSSNFSILYEDELQIWKEVNRCRLNLDEKKKQKQMKKNLKASQRKKSADISNNLQGVKPESKPQAENTICASGVFFVFLLCELIHNLFRNLSKYSWWFFIMSTFVGVGDKAMLLPDDNGCFRASVKSPINHFQFQEFNFTSHLTYRRTNFFGRKWLFQDLENIFENDQEVQGVLITGEPGSGKSAIMSQLICSPHSSLLIHDNIIGYHLCDYSEKGKRDGPRFVRNLVDQIAGSIPEYSDRIAENEQIRRMLDKRCENDVIGCFYGAIVAPLREIKNQLNQSLQYIVIDALDECMEKDGKTSQILKILSNKILDFPKWLKLILSSRNWTTITKMLPRAIKQIALDPADGRNLEDIHSYITYFLFRNSYFMDRLLEAMGLTSTTEGINSLVNELSKKGGGNFLCVTTTLQYLNNSSGRINVQSFPTRLYDTYSIYFTRLFDEENFGPFRTVFEVLLASNSPLKPSDIDTIFKLQNLTYKASELVKKISCFLRFGENGTVWIYHQSFAEWLMNQTDHTGWLFIAKSRGHKFVAEYYFEVIRQKLYSPSLHELTELATHSLAGGIIEELKLWLRQKLKLMNVSKIRDPNTESCILHDLAMYPTSTSLLNIFLDEFPAVDIPDTLGMTPAFYAAMGGHIEHLKLFIKKGININYIVKIKVLKSKIPVISILKKITLFEDFSLIHIAAFMGHTKIIKVLIKSGASFREFGGNRVTPLQIAARQNHLEVVKLLCQYGVQADVTALHHAAAKNHAHIVHYLLKHTNVRDECLPCKPGNISDFDENTTLHDIHISFCETALHAAVSRGHLEIVKLLLSFGNASLECKHHSGKTPLMAAVERNDQEMVTLLLEAGADVEAACDHEITQLSISTKFICLFQALFGRLYTLDCGKDICSYSNRAIHLCAKYGFWEIAEKLILKWNADMLALTSDGEIPVFIATKYDHVDFVNNFTRSFSKKTDDIVGNEKVLLRAALCGSSKTLRWLLSQITDRNYFGRPYIDGKTLLHHASSWSPYPNSTGIKIHFCLQGQWNRRCIPFYNCSVLAEELKKEYEKRLRIVKLLAQSQKDVSSFVNKKDDHGRTALHHAAFAGFAGAVRFLVRQGSDWRSKDRDGNRPLDLALRNSPLLPEFFNRCLSTNDKVFRTCNTTLFDETLKYLLWLNRSNIKTCDVDTTSLLYTVVLKGMPLSLYTLLKIGADMNCSAGRPIRLFLLHLIGLGGEQVSEVFKIFKVNVTLECNVPFNKSELHLISHAYVSGDISNFFKPSINNQPSPMQRLASYHPKGIRIFDECRDKEGYLPIHRAVQGGNFEAIQWLISSGVNLSLKTQSGLTVLDLSIMVLDQFISTRRQIDFSVEKIVSNANNFKRNRILTFQKMLEEDLKGMKYDWYSKWCNPKLEMLSPLHIASTKGIGMFEFVYKKVIQIAPDGHVPLNCTNKHGVTPLYLAYIYENAQIPCNYANLSSLKASHLNVDKTYLKYPVREAEYHIIYNYFYNFFLNVSYFFELHDIPDCPGFDDLLPKKKTLDIKMKQCNYDCLLFTMHVQENVLDAFPSFDFQEYNVCKLGPALVNKLKMSELQYFIERNKVDVHLAQQVARGVKCASECRCIEIMQLLQNLFTYGLKARKDRQVNKFMAERMGWTNMSSEGDVQERWPFHFLFKKMMKKYQSFDYLKNLNGEGIIRSNSKVYCDFNISEDENNEDDESGN